MERLDRRTDEGVMDDPKPAEESGMASTVTSIQQQFDKFTDGVNARIDDFAKAVRTTKESNSHSPRRSCRHLGTNRLSSAVNLVIYY